MSENEIKFPKPAKPTKEQVKWDAETVEYEEVEEKNQR